MRTLTHLIAGGIAAVALLAGTAATATAQSQTIKDKRADVFQYDDDTDPESEGTQLGKSDSTASGVDITSLKAKHSKKTVTVTMKFARLSSETTAYAVIRVNGKKQPSYIAFNGTKKTGFVYTYSGKEKCTAPVKTKLGKSGYVKVTIKNKCLGKPKKVRVSGFADRMDGETSGFSDALSKSSSNSTPQWTKWLKAS